MAQKPINKICLCALLPTDKAIFRSNPNGLQGRATQYVSKKTVQTAYNGYEDGFQTLWEGKAVWTG